MRLLSDEGFCYGAPRHINTISLRFLEPLAESMNLLSSILFSVLPILTLAQNVVISYPPEGQNVFPGQSLTVQVSRPVRLSSPFLLSTCHLTNP